MAMSDPIADMLTRVRNALQAGDPTVIMPASRLKEEICGLLKREGYIMDYALEETEDKQGQIRISLKYLMDRTPVIQGLRRISKPSLRVHVRCKDIKPVRSGLGVSVLSTSSGIMTGKQARAAKVGGELLCEIW